jgi:hypothetical protein
MGLFPISPVKRFLDSANSEDVYTGVQLLVSGFFQAMQAQQIYFKYGMHPLAREMMRKYGIPGGKTERFGAGGRLLSSVGDDEEVGGGDERIVVESAETAVETCASRMAKLENIPGVSRGIAFGLGSIPNNPASSWSIVLHRGPLPLVEIELSEMNGFHPPSTFRDVVVQGKFAHVFTGSKFRTSGGGDQLFLMLKRWKLFNHSRGNAGNDSVAAGKLLRNACREVWQKQTGDADALSELSSWNWKRKRFVRKFDQILAEHCGAQNLNAILKKMDTRLESWLAACEQ